MNPFAYGVMKLRKTVKWQWDFGGGMVKVSDLVTARRFLTEEGDDDDDIDKDRVDIDLDGDRGGVSGSRIPRDLYHLHLYSSLAGERGVMAWE